MGLKIVGEIERVDAKQLSYHDFVENYMKKNQPVVLSGLMDGWQACKDWVKPNGEPNLAFFSNHFGESNVQVADCGRREFTDQKRKEMSVAEFIGHWRGLLDQSGNYSLLYLKDWHFVKEYPNYVAYVTPPFFLDDWLNMYLDSYPMHKDTVEDTISINHNWFNAYNLSWVWSLLVKDYNEAKEYIEDIRDICDDFEGLCQRNLAANTGMNFPDFFIFITRLAVSNMNRLHRLEDKRLYLNSLAIAHHLLSNLLSIRKVAEEMKSAECFKVKRRGSDLVQNEGALQDIGNLFGEPEFHELSRTANGICDTLASFMRPDNEMAKVLRCAAQDLAEKENSAGSDIISNHSRSNELSFSILDPEDLVRVINCTLRKFGRFACEMELK